MLVLCISIMATMEEFQGLVQVKTCDTELGAGSAGPGMEPGGHPSLVTSVANNNKFSRCEGCGELILDRLGIVTRMNISRKRALSRKYTNFYLLKLF